MTTPTLLSSLVLLGRGDQTPRPDWHLVGTRHAIDGLSMEGRVMGYLDMYRASGGRDCRGWHGGGDDNARGGGGGGEW